MAFRLIFGDGPPKNVRCRSWRCWFIYTQTPSCEQNLIGTFLGTSGGGPEFVDFSHFVGLGALPAYYDLLLEKQPNCP